MICISKKYYGNEDDNVKIEVVYKGCGEELQNFIFEYCETTTLADLLNELGLNPLDCIDKENNLCHYTRGENVYLAVKYIIKDGIVKWIVPVEQCTIEEYLNQFNLTSIIWYRPDGIGACGIESFWSFLITVINGAYTTMDFIVTMVDSFNLGKSVISYISKKFLHIPDGVFPPVDNEYVNQFICEKKVWSIDVFMYEFDLDDKEFARFLLYINGYIYDELTNLYFFSNELHMRNKRKYNEALQEYSNSLNRTLG